MRHALMYQGSYEGNFSRQRPGTHTFLGTDGAEHQIPAWPESADGLHIGYMEKAGKKFVAVRVESGDSDVVLEHEVVIDPPRHMGYGKRFAPEPTLVDDDEVALALLDDIIRKNPGQQAELNALRARLGAAHARERH